MKKNKLTAKSLLKKFIINLINKAIEINKKIAIKLKEIKKKLK